MSGKGASNRGASLTKTGLVGAIEQSGSKLDSRRPGTGWVGGWVGWNKRAIREQSIGGSEHSSNESCGASDQGKMIRERVNGEQANLGTMYK